MKNHRMNSDRYVGNPALHGDFAGVLACYEIPIANVANIDLGLTETMVTLFQINWLAIIFSMNKLPSLGKLHSHTCQYDSRNQKKCS